jgi:amidase
VLARRVDDAAWFIGALTRWDLDPRPIEGLRIGVCRGPYWDAADGDTRRVFEEGLRLCEQAGAQLADIVLPRECGDLNDAQVTIMSYEAAAAFQAEASTDAAGFSPSFAQLLDRGARIPGEAYVGARRLAAGARQGLAHTFESCDVLLAPSTIGEAPRGLESTGDPVFNRMWSLLGNPCVHLPIGSGASGMPVGVTVVGGLYEDARTLSAAWMLERVAPGTDAGRRP